MNKRFLITEIIKELEMEKTHIEASIETTLRTAVEAPGAMQSHSDTTKSQMHAYADNLKKSLAEKELAIKTLLNFPENQLQQKNIVEIGSLITIQKTDDTQNSYFILPEGGGVTITNEGKNITSITPNSPLASILMGKKKGDLAQFQTPSTSKNKREIVILDVQ